MRLIKPLVLITLLALGGCQSAPQQSIQYIPDPVADINVRLAAAYIREGRLELALDKLQRALIVDPNLPSAHYTAGVVYARLGEPEKAEAHYRHALRLDPGNSKAHTNYGTFLCENNRGQEAEIEFLAALANPRYRSPELAYSNAGQCAMRFGDDDKADVYLRKALEIAPSLPPALIGMSELSLRAGRHMSARAYLERYLQTSRQTAASLWLGIQIERVLGDKNMASSYAMLLKSKYPDSVQTRALLESNQSRE